MNSVAMILMFGSLIVLFVLGAPVAICLGLSSLLYFSVVGIPLHGIAQKMIFATDNFVLIAIPLFILAAHVMNVTDTTHRIFRFANTLVRHLRGGLAHVNVVASMLFAGMSGSALADVAGLGLMEIDAMKKEGYDEDFSIAVTAASSTIGPVIPPSISFVIYAWIAEVSVGQLFIAGFVPGAMMGLWMILANYLISVKRGYPREKRVSFKEFLSAFLNAIIPLMTPVIILGGIYLGIFTPTEAAVVATLYAIAMGVFVYRKLKFSDFVDLCYQVLVDTALAMFILAAATAFNWILTREQIPVKLAEIIFNLISNKYVFIFVLNIFFLVLGMVMENTAIIIIFTPIMLPLISGFGISPIHFGVFFVLNIMIGLITPPFGIVLYMISAITRVDIRRIARALIPYYFVLVLNLILISYVPAFSLFLIKLLNAGS